MAQRDDDTLATMRAGAESPTAGHRPQSGRSRRRAQPAPHAVTYSMSPGFAGFLGSQRIALAISSYQSGKFYLLGQNVEWRADGAMSASSARRWASACP